MIDRPPGSRPARFGAEPTRPSPCDRAVSRPSASRFIGQPGCMTVRRIRRFFWVASRIGRGRRRRATRGGVIVVHETCTRRGPAFPCHSRKKDPRRSSLRARRRSRAGGPPASSITSLIALKIGQLVACVVSGDAESCPIGSRPRPGSLPQPWKAGARARLRPCRSGWPTWLRWMLRWTGRSRRWPSVRTNRPGLDVFPSPVGPMKLKCQPEDFRVEELTDAQIAGSGRYTFYRLSKRDLGTIEAVEAICRRWNLSGRRVSYAGLKDRHAATVQYLTIADGPSHEMSTPQFELEPLGRLGQPYSSRQLLGNRFEMVLRDLDARRARPRHRARSRTSPGSACPTTSTISGSGRWASRASSSPQAWLRRRSRTRAEAGDGRGEPLRPLGGQGGEGDPARVIGETGPRRSGSCRGRRPAAS